MHFEDSCYRCSYLASEKSTATYDEDLVDIPLLLEIALRIIFEGSKRV